MLNEIKKKLDAIGHPYFELDEGIILDYTSDGASLKLADGIFLGNGSDGWHTIAVVDTHPEIETTGTYIKLDRFAFYKHDFDEEPLFVVEGFTMIFEQLGRGGHHGRFVVKV